MATRINDVDCVKLDIDTAIVSELTEYIYHGKKFMRAVVKWLDGVSFVAESGSAHSLVMDGSAEHGGRNIGPRPMELILMGLGGCASFDVITILQKARQYVTACELELQAQRADSVPAVFTKITMCFVVTGKGLKESQVKRAVELSAEKYCSASKMLEDAGVEIIHDYRIEEV